MDENWNNTILDDQHNSANDYKKYLKGILYYVLGLIVFGGLPFLIMAIFSPNGFQKFMNYSSEEYSYWTLYFLFGIAAVFLIIILVKLFLYFKNKRKYS
ncbi:MAG: hypothetical protein GY810_05455 [Aureispira sp.]|nr:hypothetical protein [Aureispira sp.]